MTTIKGFTLLELLITITILGLALSFGIDALTRRITQDQSAVTAQRLFHTLHFARLEAVKRNQIVGICGTQDFKHCSTDWNSGFLVYVDTKQGEHTNTDTEKEILLVERYDKQLLKIDTGKTTVFKYAPNGRSLTRGTIQIQRNEQVYHSIILYNSGRARIEKHSAQLT